MMAGVTGRSIGGELTELWGWRECRDIKIHIPLNGIVTITAEFNATRDQMDQCDAVIKKYRLEEIPEPKEKGIE
jgi:hypothetical protein